MRLKLGRYIFRASFSFYVAAMEPIPPWLTHGHMTIEEFMDGVDSGCLTDYDGYGEWATATHIFPGQEYGYIIPSMASQPRPPQATHVAWYNK